MPDATLTIVRDEAGERCVVTHADDVIWVADDLWSALFNPDRPRIPGDAELTGLDDDLLTFGTDGEGLGRLTYRRTGYGDRFIICERVKGRDAHPWQEYNQHGNTCHYPGCQMTEDQHPEIPRP